MSRAYAEEKAVEQGEFKHGDLAFVRTAPDNEPVLGRYTNPDKLFGLPESGTEEDYWVVFGTDYTFRLWEVTVIKRVRLVEQVTSGGFGWVDINGNLEK